MKIHNIGSLVTTIALACCVGCGGADDKIPVNGIVLSDGKPLAGASVAFIGNNGGAFSSATTDAKGAFALRTVAGKNKVAVSKVDTSKVQPPVDPSIPQVMPTDTEYAIMAKNAPKSLVAEKFADPEKSGIVIDVVGGMSSVDINVTSQ